MIQNKICKITYGTSQLQCHSIKVLGLTSQLLEFSRTSNKLKGTFYKIIFQTNKPTIQKTECFRLRDFKDITTQPWNECSWTWSWFGQINWKGCYVTNSENVNMDLCSSSGHEFSAIPSSGSDVFGKDVEKRELLCTVGRNVNWCSYYRKQYRDSSKIENRTTTWSSDSLSGYLSKDKNTTLKRYAPPQFTLFTTAKIWKQVNG